MRAEINKMNTNMWIQQKQSACIRAYILVRFGSQNTVGGQYDVMFQESLTLSDAIRAVVSINGKRLPGHMSLEL